MYMSSKIIYETNGINGTVDILDTTMQQCTTSSKPKKSFDDKMVSAMEQVRLACGGAILGICLFHIFGGGHGNDTNDMIASAFGAVFSMTVLHFDRIKSIFK